MQLILKLIFKLIDALIRLRIQNGTWIETNAVGEVWIAVFADSGGGVFKMVATLGNRTGPINSIENALLLCTFEADETASNIRKVLRPISEEIMQFVNG